MTLTGVMAVIFTVSHQIR